MCMHDSDRTGRKLLSPLRRCGALTPQEGGSNSTQGLVQSEPAQTDREIFPCIDRLDATGSFDGRIAQLPLCVSETSCAFPFFATTKKALSGDQKEP